MSNYQSTTTTTPAESDVAVIFDHAARLCEPVRPPTSYSGSPVILVPRGYQIQRPEGWEPEEPPRLRQTVSAEDVESFCRYVQTFRTATTQVFASGAADLSVVAILDYHYAAANDTNGARWCGHRVTLKPSPSPRWKALVEANGKKMGQIEFACWIENMIPAIATPPGADLLQIVSLFEVDGKVAYSRAVRLQDGSTKMLYQHEVAAKSGEVTIPAQILFSLPMYEGEPNVQIAARLRYRLDQQGVLSLWFELANLDDVRRQAATVLCDRIKAGTGFAPFRAAV